MVWLQQYTLALHSHPLLQSFSFFSDFAATMPIPSSNTSIAINGMADDALFAAIGAGKIKGLEGEVEEVGGKRIYN